MLNDARYTHVLHKYGIHMNVGEQIEHIAKVIHFALLDQRVNRHIDLFAPFMRIGDCIAKLIRVKVSRIAARAEGRIAQIDSVRAACDCRNQRFAVSRR